jgi:hypothetical protein
MSQYRIVKTAELTNRPNPSFAKDLLERLVAATAKVVENRKWKVPILKEFYPSNKSLLGLNVNRGQSIMIRLRSGNDEFEFLPWHSVLGTLVHELTHIVVGEHSAEFYKTMEIIYDEVEASSSTYTIWGSSSSSAPVKSYLVGSSSKVGGGVLAKQTGIPADSVRRLAAEAAIIREQTSGVRLGPSGGIKLGTKVGGLDGLDMVEVALTKEQRKERFMAAQRERARTAREQSDVKSTPSFHSAGGGGSPGLLDCSQSQSQSQSQDAAGDAPPAPATSDTSHTLDTWQCAVCFEKNYVVVPVQGCVVCNWCGTPIQQATSSSSSSRSSAAQQTAPTRGGAVGALGLTEEIYCLPSCSEQVGRWVQCLCCRPPPGGFPAPAAAPARLPMRNKVVGGRSGAEEGTQEVVTIDIATGDTIDIINRDGAALRHNPKRSHGGGAKGATSSSSSSAGCAVVDLILMDSNGAVSHAPTRKKRTAPPAVRVVGAVPVAGATVAAELEIVVLDD